MLGFLAKLFRPAPPQTEAPPDAKIEDMVPAPSEWPDHSARTEARIPELVGVLRNARQHRPDDQRIPEWERELVSLLGLSLPNGAGVSIDAPAAHIDLEPR